MTKRKEKNETKSKIKITNEESEQVENDFFDRFMLEEKESSLLSVKLIIPQQNNPLFLVQYNKHNHVFLNENEKIKSNLENTMRELLQLNHSLGRDFKYFHFEEMVKSFLPLQIVSQSSVNKLNLEKIKKRKKEYLKEQKKAKKTLDVIQEEDGPYETSHNTMTMNINPNEHGNTIADKKIYKDVSIDFDARGGEMDDRNEMDDLNLDYSNRRDGEMNGLNSSLRSTNELQFNIKKKDMNELKEDLSKDTTFVGYRGGSKQFVSDQYNHINILGGYQDIHKGPEKASCIERNYNKHNKTKKNIRA